MGLTGLQIFKLLPNTNCRDCGYPTCLAFAMKIATGKEALDKCPHASPEAHAAIGAAAAPPIQAVTIGVGERAITVGEETVFFRHDKTFVRAPGLFRVINAAAVSESDAKSLLDGWARIAVARAGETFRVDGVTVVEASGTPAAGAAIVAAAAQRGFPIVILAQSIEGASAMVDAARDRRPLLVPPSSADPAAYAALAARHKIPLVVSGADLTSLSAAAEAASRAGVSEILLEPVTADLKELHHLLSSIRRGALDRVHPGLGHPVFLRIGKDEFEKAVLGIVKFGSVLVLEDHDGGTWLPLWTLRQNVYTDPQKPLRIDPGVYPIGEPALDSPLAVTTNFSLTYFMVSTEIESTGVPCHLAVVDTEGMSVLTAWSAGKFSGDKVAKALLAMDATGKVNHKTTIIPGYVAVISGELEDALGNGWRVVTGPQDASDIGAFFRDMPALSTVS